MDMYNLTYDELQKNIVQVRKKHFLDDLTSPALIRERGMWQTPEKNISVIAIANLAFVGGLNSNKKYLMVENKKFANNL